MRKLENGIKLTYDLFDFEILIINGHIEAKCKRTELEEDITKKILIEYTDDFIRKLASSYIQNFKKNDDTLENIDILYSESHRKLN